MSLAVVDHEISGQTKGVRVAFDTAKLSRAVEFVSKHSEECAGESGCIVEQSYERVKNSVADFALAWARDHETPHPGWLVYVYEVDKVETKVKAKAKAKSHRRKKPAVRR